MTYFIRTAVDLDFEGISAVFAEDNSYHADLVPDQFQVVEPIITREWFDKVLANQARTLIVAISAETDKSEVGGVVLAGIHGAPENPIFRPRRYVYVSELAVGSKYQRRGIGRLLMGGVSAWALARGIKEIELNVWEANRAAIAFYERLGYECVRRTMRLSL